MFILLLSLFTIKIFACDFSTTTKDVYSLSGAVTQSFQDFALLKSPKLKGVSIFHPVSINEFKGTFYPGGIFLSHDTLKKFSGSTLLYDESRELTKVLARHPEIRAIEIKTRNLAPLEVIDHLEVQTRTILTGCDFKKLKQNLTAKLEEIKKVIPKNKTILFFLGQIQDGRYPEMLMVNDGIVKWMVQEKLVKTYDSKLAYVNWSAKQMNEMDKDVLKVGIKDSGNVLDKKMEKVSNGFNLTYPGAYIPGRGQVEAMIYFFRGL